jgi:hypothetical protein
MSRSDALLAAPEPAVDDQRKPRRSPGKPRTEGEGEAKPAVRRPAKKADEVKPEAAPTAPKAPVKRVRKAPAKADGVDSAAKEGKE